MFSRRRSAAPSRNCPATCRTRGWGSSDSGVGGRRPTAICLARSPSSQSRWRSSSRQRIVGRPSTVMRCNLTDAESEPESSRSLLADISQRGDQSRLGLFRVSECFSEFAASDFLLLAERKHMLHADSPVSSDSSERYRSGIEKSVDRRPADPEDLSNGSRRQLAINSRNHNIHATVQGLAQILESLRKRGLGRQPTDGLPQDGHLVSTDVTTRNRAHSKTLVPGLADQATRSSPPHV